MVIKIEKCSIYDPFQIESLDFLWPEDQLERGLGVEGRELFNLIELNH